MSIQRKQNFKIKQFEWYEVETKVRQIITDLFQNFNKKQMEETIKINQMKRNVADITKKLQDHDFLLNRQNATKPSYIQQQDQKIQQYKQYVLLKQSENERRLNTFQQVIHIYEDRMKQMNLLQSRLDKQIVTREQLFDDYLSKTKRELSQIQSKFTTHAQQILQFKNTTKGIISKCQSKMIGFDNRIRQLQDDRKFKTLDVNKLIQESKSHYRDIHHLGLKASDLEERISDREKDTKLSQKFIVMIKEMQNNYSFIGNFIEQYLPLYNQMQISDTLNSFIQGKQRTKLYIYEEQKFAKIHKKILLNEKEGLAGMMNHYSSSIRRIIQRNKGYLINLQIEKTVQFEGITYQLRKNTVQESNHEEKKAVVTTATVSTEEVERITTYFLKQFQNDFSSKLERQIGLTKTWVKQLQEQFTMRQVQFDKKQSQFATRIKDLQIKQQLHQKYISSELTILSNKHNRIETTFVNFKQCMRDILNFGSVVNHIVIQDQIDRQSTALYAINSKATGEIMQSQTLQLDTNCLNCQTKNIGLIQQAFKIACLLYNPSQINIDDKSFSREQILQISTNILEKIKKKLSNIDSNALENTLSNFKISNQIQRRSKEKITKESIQLKSFRKSTSGFKQSVSSRPNSRNKEFQTLLPILASTKFQKRQKKSSFSIFY